MTKALIINRDKTDEIRDINGLKDMQAVVDGYIECVSLKFGDMWVNEEFLFSFGPEDFNSIASDVAGLGGRQDLMLTGILGDVLITGHPDGEGDLTDVTDEAIRAFNRVAREARL